MNENPRKRGAGVVSLPNAAASHVPNPCKYTGVIGELLSLLRTANMETVLVSIFRFFSPGITSHAFGGET
jgi:hypothetical protein